MDSDSSDDENMFIPIPTPVNRRGQRGTVKAAAVPVSPRAPTPTPTPSLSLPVQLTWKGVQIYFPSVVLKPDLKAIADEALAKQIAGEKFIIPNSSSNNSHALSSSATTTPGSSKTPQKHSTIKVPTSRKKLSPKTSSSISKGRRRPSGSSVVSASTTRSSSTTPTFEGNAPSPCDSGSKSQHQCGICYCTFRSEYALSRHANVHSNAAGNKHGPCKCGAKFVKRLHLVRHMSMCGVVANTDRSTKDGTTTIQDQPDQRSVVSDGKNTDNESLIRIKMESVEDLNNSGNDEGLDFDGEENEDDDQDQIPVVTSVSSIASDALQCERCGAQFSLNVQFKHHKINCARMCESVDKKGRARKYHCEQCPWKFLFAHELKRHQLLHDGARPFQCSTCLEGFARKDYLTNHQLKVCNSATSSAVPGPVKESQKSSTSSSSAHSMAVTQTVPNVEKMTTDDNLESSYSSAAEPSLEKENNSKSVSNSSGKAINAFDIMMQAPFKKSKAKPTTGLQFITTDSGVECKICSRKFTGIAYLRQHACRPAGNFKRKTEYHFQRATCPLCGLSSVWKNIPRHFRTAHKCLKCGMDFKDGAEKATHVQLCQESSIPRDSELYWKIKCYICQDSFRFVEFVRHMVSNHGLGNISTPNVDSAAHTEESPHLPPTLTHSPSQFKCDTCGKTFSDKMKLSRHCFTHAMKDAQSQPKPSTTSTIEPPPRSSSTGGPLPPPMFTCKFSSCTRFFSHDEDLWFHVDLKHRSVGNICCGQCGQDFKTEELVNQHEQSAHGPASAAPEESAFSGQDLNFTATSIQVIPESRPKSPLSILSMDIARIMEDPPPTPLKSHSSALPLSIIPRIDNVPSHIQPVDRPILSILKTVLKKKQDEQTEEDGSYQEAADDTSPFDDDTFPNDDFANDDVPDSPQPALIRETKIFAVPPQEYSPFPKPVSNPNPFVFITAQCKAIAEEALQNGGSIISSTNIAETSSNIIPPVPHGLDSYTCEICPDFATFNERDSFIQHLQEEHDSAFETFTCHVCSVSGISKTFHNRHAYRLHLNYHRHKYQRRPPTFVPIADEYFCENCHNRKFTDRKLYLNHLKYHASILKKRGFDGPLPGRGVGNRRGFRTDIPIQDEYTCTDCEDERKFTDRKAYIRHFNYHIKMRRRGFVSGRKPTFRRVDIPIQDEYTCTDCEDERKFTDRKAYIRHLHYHTKMRRLGVRSGGGTGVFRRLDIPVQDEYTCSECDDERKFTDRQAFISHLNYHKKMKIELEKKNKRHANLRPDIPMSATGEYSCSTCHDRTFQDRLQYVMHVKYHEGIVEREGQDRPIGTPSERKSNSLVRPDIPVTDTYTCATCNGREFSERYQYIVHARYHEQIVEREGQDRPIATLHDRKNRSVIRQQDVPLADIYTCATCHNREFTDRVVYVNHLNYHEHLKRQGEDRPVGQGPGGGRWGGLLRPDIPLADEYTCDLCEDKKTFTERAEYLNHLNYHKRVQQKSFKSGRGKNWRRKQAGGGAKSWQEDIPFAETYKCETCPGRNFTNRESYIGHIGYHRLLEKKGCNRAIMTKEEWAQNKERQKHWESDDKNSYECEICSDGRTFVSKSSYISHMIYHQRLKKMGIHRKIKKRWDKKSPEDEAEDCGPHTCSICEDRTFSTRLKYNAHLAYHEKIRLLEGKDRPIRTDWREHRKKTGLMNQIPDLEEYACEICNDGRTFTNKLNYYAHMSYHKKREQLGLKGPLRKRGANVRDDIPIADIYTCNRCDTARSFTDRKAFIMHMYYHDYKDKQAQGPSSASAITAPGQATTPRIIRRRRSRGSGFDPPYQSVYRCKYCLHLNKTFTDRHKFIVHMNYHKYQKSQVIKASSSLTPAVVGHSSSSISKGGQSIDSEDKFYCTQCGTDTVFTCRDTYEKHMKDHRDMKKNKEFQCSICEKAFSNIWNLKNHAKMHTGEKNYVCGDCGKRFITDNMLQQHQNTKCKKVPCKYTCHCGDKFHNVESLEVHVKKNHIDGSVSKIFRCYVCNDQFLQAFELDQHVKENHPVDYAEFMQHKAEKAGLKAEGISQEDQDAGEDDQEPFYPEVLMACYSDDEECNTGGEKEGSGSSTSNRNDTGATLSSTDVQDEEKEVVGGGWNFIPGLTGDIESNEEDDERTSESEEEIDPASFEPEDVDVPVSTLVDSYPHLSLTVASDQSNSTAASALKRRRTKQTSSDDDWAPSPQGQMQGQTINSSSGAFPKRKFRGDGKFQCGYCPKVSHRVPYIKSHSSRLHPGVPFKVINLQARKGGEDAISPEVRQNIQKILARKPSTDDPSTSTSLYPARPFRYVLPQQAPIATISPLTQSVSHPPTNTSTSSGRRNSNDGNKQRPGPICGCTFEDTALGYLKRCTGETCACYTRYKGCSDQCDCKRSCGNPYIRFRTTPEGHPPTEAVADTMTLSSGSDLQGGQTVASGQSAPRTTAPCNTLQDVVHGMIENMMSAQNQRVVSITGINPPQPKSSFITSNLGQQQTRTLGNVTGYAIPITYENSNTTTTGSGSIDYTSSREILARMLANPVANVPPSQTTSTPSTFTPQFTHAANLNVTYSPTTNKFSIQADSSSGNTGGVVSNHFSSTSTSDLSKIYRCFCHQDFNTLSSFLMHQWSHKEERLFLCPICKKQFNSVNLLILHARGHTEIETIAMIPCPACDRIMADTSELDRHFTTCHATLICGVCDKYCSSSGDLSSHRLTHGVCNICGLTFFNQTAMRNHLARDHPNAGSVLVQPLPPPTSPFSNFSDTRQQLMSATVSSGGGTEPEVVTLVDDDDEEEVRPPSPEGPQIVSVTSNAYGTIYEGSRDRQEFGYFG